MTDETCSSPPAADLPTGWLAERPLARRHVLLAWGCIVVVYAAGVTGKWWPTPDSAVYLSLARSLAQGEGYMYNGATNVTVTPGLPAILGGLRLAFGENYWVWNGFISACALASFWIIYVTIARLSDRRLALSVVIATAVSCPFFIGSQKILTGIPFVLMFWSILYFCVRARQGHAAWRWAAAPLVVLAVFVWAPGVLVIGPLGVGLLSQPRRKGDAGRPRFHGLIVLAAMAAISIALLVAARLACPTGSVYVAEVTKSAAKGVMFRIEMLLGGLWQIPFTLAEMFTGQEALAPVGGVILVLMVIGGVFLWKRGQRYLPVFIVLCFLDHAILGHETVRPRYLLPLLPVFAYLASQGLC